MANDDDARSALGWLRRVHAENELLREVAARIRRKRACRATGAGTLLLVILLGALALQQRREPARPAISPAPLAATATVSRPELQTLPDGSMVELKDGAKVTVDYNVGARRITLVSGEAHFQVAKNQERPFIVQAGQVEVRAIGTAFSVQVGSDAVAVLVTEGTVRVNPDTALPAEESVALVGAGRRCVVDSSEKIARIYDLSGSEADEQLAWRIPQLEFSRTPLSEVVALVNDHVTGSSGTPLEIADAGLAEIKLTGFLRADNVDGLVRLLEMNFHVAAVRSPQKILLMKAKMGTAGGNTRSER